MAPRKEVAKVAAKQEVATVTEEQRLPGVQVIDDAETLAELRGVEGAGYSENLEDRGVPLLYIAQKGSPQLDKKKEEKYIEGLEFGDVFNNLSRQFWKAEADGVPLAPCFFRGNWNEWTPRDEGGGFHGSHPRDTELLKGAKRFVDKKGKSRQDILDLPNGNQLVWTVHYYCMNRDTWEPIIVPMSSTQLSPSRTWQNLIGAQKGQVNGNIIVLPAFWTIYDLKTVYKDDGDNQWYVYNPLILEKNEDRKFKQFCKDFAIAVARNEVKTAAPEGVDTTALGGEPPV